MLWVEIVVFLLVAGGVMTPEEAVKSIQEASDSVSR